MGRKRRKQLQREQSTSNTSLKYTANAIKLFIKKKKDFYGFGVLIRITLM